jgi:sugar lactone lactonase YvrE
LIFHGGECELVSGLGSDKTSTIRVPGSFVLPESVAWSSDGSTAILYSRTGNWIQILSGLPSAVNPAAPLSTAPLGGTLSAVVTDSHGEQIAIGVVGATAGIYQLANGTNFVPLLSFSKPVALGFSDDSGTLYGVDAGNNQLFALTMANLTSQSWPLSGVANPIAIRLAHDASDRAVIYVAGGTDRLIETYDPSTHQLLASAQLNFEPNVIEPLGIKSFVLASRATSDDILWSFRNTPQPTVYFVPAPPVQLRESTRK